MSSNKEFKEVAALFLKLGITAFGGPAAHIAMMQHEVVNKRKWMDEEHFLDLFGATNLIPGPNSTEMAIHIGRERAGWKGLIVAGLCFILPAVIITGLFAWLYRQYGQLPQIKPFVYGIKPAVIAIILAAVYPLTKKTIKSVEILIIGIIVLTFSLLGWNEIYLMFGAGFFALFTASIRNKGFKKIKLFSPFTLLQASKAALLPSNNLKIFLIFLKIGAILYGSGYVLFAFLDSELVSKGLISRQLLIDAIALGQFTPGPVFSSVTFIGYQLNGMTGAILSTIGIFLPSFVFVALLNPLISKMRGSFLFSAFLNAVNIASISIIIAICYTLGKESIYDWRTIVIMLISMFILFGFRKRINNVWIVLGGSLAGYLLAML